MNWLKKHASKFRFSFEIAVLLLLAVYVTVQAGNLNHANATLANRAFASATSTVPGLLNYQGYLTDSGGAPLDGAYAIKFAIYDALTGGTELWSETQLAVQINDGQLSALLGETEPISPTLFATYPDTFIGVTLGSDPEMTPRQRIHSVPYAMHAEDGVPAGTVIQYYPPLGTGDPCPAGYLLADGTNGTPDLSGLFLRSAGNFPEGGSGIVGDSDIPTHRHNVHIQGQTGDSNSNTRRARGDANKTAYAGHEHNVNFWNWSEYSHSIPPYFVVNFCIKQ
jgi:hypothetical protein